MIALTKTIVKRPVAATIIIAGIILFGIMSIFSLPKELTPELNMPYLIIVTTYPGAGPEDVEKLVSKPVEESAASLSGVKSITSMSSENMSLVLLQYDYGLDMNNAYSDVKTKLDGIVRSLPDDAGTPLVIELDINAQAVMNLSVTSETEENLLAFVDEEIVPQLEKLFSVSQVSVYGGRESYIRVELSEEMLRQYGINMSSVIGALANVDYTAPLGSANFGDSDISVRTQIRYDSLEAMRNIPVPLRTGGVIRLSDVANLYMTTDDAASVSRYNGQDNIGIGINRRQSISADRVSRDVQREIDQINRTNPGINITVVYDSSEQITSSINSIFQTMIMAVLLSMLVLYLFLGDIRASVIVGSSMPVSLLITFIFLNLMGFTLNIVTMSGLVLGIGMMVDNAIVVIDSCFKSNRKDKTFIQAAVDGTQFVLLSVFAVTLTTVVVFLPLAFTYGIVGQMFKPLALSIVFSLVASLFSAITLVPLFFVQLKPIERKKAPLTRLFKKMEQGYANLLGKILNKKKIVIFVSVAFVVLSGFLATQINMELMPSTDEGIISISVETKPGLKLERKDEILTALEDMIASHPDVERYTVSSGGGGLFGGGGSSSVTAYLYKNRSMSTNQIIEKWRQDTRYFVDCDLEITSSSSMGMGDMGGGNSVEVKLAGDNFDNLREAVAQTIAIMDTHPDIIRVTSSVDNPSPQAEIVIDPLKAASMNLTPQLVTSGVYTALNGSKAAEINIEGQKYEIKVEYPKGKYESVSDVINMSVISSTGASVPLSEVAAIKFSDTPQTIQREEGQYVATITGSTKEGAHFTAQKEIDEQMAQAVLPRGVATTINSQAEMMNEELGSLGTAILVAILLVFMVLAIQFESIRHSLMVMVCVPFAMVGSFTMLFLTDTTFSMVSMLGLLVLVGTVINNGILYVDITNKFRQEMDVESALILTGKTRLRAILMMTLTTVLALMPLALGIGEGAQMMQGLAIVVIGGLMTSTVMALLFLPTFYLLIDGNPEKRAARKQRRMDKRSAKVAATEIENEEN